MEIISQAQLAKKNEIDFMYEVYNRGHHLCAFYVDSPECISEGCIKCCHRIGGEKGTIQSVLHKNCGKCPWFVYSDQWVEPSKVMTYKEYRKMVKHS